MIDSNKNKSCPPNFLVVGLNKSGTYWLTSLLNNHPKITCIPAMYGGQTGVEEGHFFDNLGSIDQDGAQRFRKGFTGSHKGYFADLIPNLEKVSRDELHKMFKERYEQWLGMYKEEGKILGEKTAEYIMYMPLLDSMYPDMKKICIFRDPKDRIVSYHFHQLRKGQKVEEELTDEYVRNHCTDRIAKDYQALLDYDGNLKVITYADMQSNTAEVVRDVFKYLNVEATDDEVNSMVEASTFESMTKKDKINTEGSRKAGEESRQSYYRKGIVGDWKNVMSDAQVSIVEEILGEMEKQIFKKYNLNK